MNTPAILILIVGIPWIIAKSSSLTIAGRTNISPFSCSVGQYAEPDTLTFLPEGSPSETVDIPLRGILKIPIAQFDCHNRLMTADLRKTLQADHYPELTIRFISLDHLPPFRATVDEVKGWVEIGLAGITKSFRIDYHARRIDSTTIELSGCSEMCFSDFGLTPPQKMGGLIKVDNALNVQFILCLTHK